MAKKRVATLVLSIALLLAVTVGGTLAYLTDTASDVNVMTLGNVDIEQHEYQRATNEDGTYKTATIDNRTSYVLEDFEQAKPLYPAIIPNGGTVNGVTWDYDSIPVRMSQVGSLGGANVFNTPNAQDKFVTVENTGKSDAYVRTFVAFEVGTAQLQDADYPNENLISSEIRAGEEADGRQPWTYGFSDYVTIDGNKYLVYELIYTGAMTSNGWKHEGGVLPAGETTYPNLCQVYMASRATNEDVEALDGNNNGTYDILVLSQAVQVAGFEDKGAAVALNTAFGEATAANVAAWFKGEELAIPTVVSTADEFVAELEDGGNVVLKNDITVTETVNLTEATNIDLNGNNLTVSVLEAKADTYISNGTLTHGKNTYPAVSVSAGTLTMENVDIFCNEACNIVTSGTAEAAEFAGFEVWSGKAVLNNCSITVETDKIRYSNSVFAVGIHEGEFVMNGGSITVNSHGSTKEKYNYEGAIFAGSAPDKAVTMNNVSVNIGEKAYYMFAWGGNTVLNTTDTTVTADAVDARNGGTCTINTIK